MSPCGCMLRKSSRVGGRANRGIVSEGASAGLGAGCTSRSLIGGSGGGDEGEGFCGGGGGGGFCRVDCGFCGLEVDCAKPEFCESFFASSKSGGRRPEAETGSSFADSKRTAAIASFARTWPFRGRTRDKRKNPSLFPAPYGGRSKIHYAVATKQQNDVLGGAEDDAAWNFSRWRGYSDHRVTGRSGVCRCSVPAPLLFDREVRRHRIPPQRREVYSPEIDSNRSP
jgi:hypothetical protein